MNSLTTIAWRARADGQKGMVGFMFDRYVFPLATGDEARLQC